MRYQFSEKTAFTILYINNKPDSGNAGIVQLEMSGENFNLRPYYSYVFGGNSKGFGVSADLSPLENIGLFFRFGKGDSKDFVSGGFELKNLLFKDKLGLGYAYLKGEGTHAVAELYYSLEILKYFTVSFDLQYLSESKNALVCGVRLHFKR